MFCYWDNSDTQPARWQDVFVSMSAYKVTTLLEPICLSDNEGIVLGRQTLPMPPDPPPSPIRYLVLGKSPAMRGLSAPGPRWKRL